MLIYYIDGQLSQAEQQVIVEQLAGFGEDVGVIKYVRIPFVFPVEDRKISNDEMTSIFCGHLNNAGVSEGQHVFLMPKDLTRWGVLFQEAFESVAGYLPFVVQPWQRTGNTTVRREHLVVMNMHLIMSKL